MRALRMALLALLLATVVSVVRASETPEQVVEAYLASIREDGVPETLARFTHPRECARLKNLLMPRIRRSFEVADDGFSRRTLGEDVPLAYIEAMPPCEMLAKFMRNAQVDARSIKPPRFLRVEHEGELVHVVIVNEFVTRDGVATAHEARLSLRAMGDTWRLVLGPEMEAYVKALVAR